MCTHTGPRIHAPAPVFLPRFFHGFYAQGPAASVGGGPSVSLPTTRKPTPQPCLRVPCLHPQKLWLHPWKLLRTVK